ncbi:E3 ubiquitin-protein ligase TRIM65-like isoform X1 [Macrobrachium nipponense]|uniref:E3 ubiquitin-protein ligase TRIM65-like isoform X1 n=2 Tax=Macrobrachium nipponense TaxID=159736 RepID=UPI0030C8C514
MKARMEEADLGCSVCQDRYNDNRIPRNLGCGHAVCTSCIEQLINNNRKCPECRRPFYAVIATTLPVNYPLLRLARSLTTRTAASPQHPAAQSYSPSASSSRSGPLDAGECAAHGSRMKSRCMTCNVWVCPDCLVMDHIVPPDGECEILPLNQALEEMKKSHMENISTMFHTIQGLKNTIGDHIAQVEANKRVHNNTAASIRAVLQGELDVVQDLDSIKKKATDKLTEIEGWVNSLKKCEECIVDAQTVRELANAKLAARDCVTTVQAHVAQEAERFSQPSATFPKFREQVNLKGALQMAKMMYVVDDSGSETKWARVSVHDCLLHLHALDTQPPPPSAVIFSYNSIREMVPEDDASAFMDLGWGGETHGRVYMRMYGNTPRAKQFLYLCSGEKGPSYRGTHFFDSFRVGEPGEIVRGGDYENDDGTGGAAILEDIDVGGPYLQEAVEGLLVGAHIRQPERLGVFGIILTAYPFSKTDTGFGVVTNGIGTLKSVSRHKPISDVAIENCGLVIPI